MAPPKARSRAAGAAEEDAPPRPSHYVATADVYTEPAEDRMPVAVFRAGDHVPVDLYDNHPMWQPLLAAAPDDAEAASAAKEDTTAPGGGTDSTGGGQGEEE